MGPLAPSREETPARHAAAATSVKSPEAIRGMFSAISGTYDLLNGVLSAGLDRGWRRRAVAACDANPAARVLDLGTGTGDLALAFLRHRGFRGHVVGVDFAGPMLSRARAKAAGERRLAWVQGDATSLPFRDGSFDLVSAAFAARNFAELPAALAACRRVLRPSGRLVLLEFFRPERLAWPLRTYLRSVVPRLGAAVSGHTSAYTYLRDSQEGFLTVEEALALFKQAGFVARRVERLFPGIATLLVLERS